MSAAASPSAASHSFDTPAAVGSTSSSGTLDADSNSNSTLSVWTPTQLAYRRVLCALRGAYYHDRAKLFWARHRARVEFYKYGNASDREAAVCHAVADDAARFVKEHMECTVERIVAHNDAMAKLPVDEAKRLRAQYLEREEQHDVWCRHKLRAILKRRPVPPYPYC
jgi:hypothetical protein